MPQEMSISKEDYLKAVIEAESEGHIVIPALLAQWLNVSAPAVTKAVKRLRTDGYLASDRDGVLKLSAKGREAARRTALRHHLVERMLSEIFGMEWHQIHTEAERLEHAISPAFEAKLIEKLGEGDCPHGNKVLPETPTQMKRRGLLPLQDAEERKKYVVESLYERDAQLLEFLHDLGIGPRTSLEVIKRNYDGTMQIAITDGIVTLGPAASSRIRVRDSRSSKPKRPKNR